MKWSAPAQEQTLLDVIKERGIEIPTLCHIEGLSERGGCRLCMVEVVGSGRLLPACVSTVQEGMEVQTHSERLMKYRRMLLELIFAEGNHVCAFCVASGNCELQWLAAEHGMDHVRYDYLSQDLPIDASHERYVTGPQPLHSLHPLRAGLRRGRGRSYLGCDGPWHRQPHHRRSEPALGLKQQLYKLRKVRAGLPDRGADRPKAPPPPRWSNNPISCAGFSMVERRKCG